MITQEFLKEYFDLREDGFLIVKKYRRGGKPVGQVAGSSDSTDGYWRLEFNKKKYRLHRLVWLYHYGELPEQHIDHINHNKLDNRVENLRLVDDQENSKNASIGKNNTSGFVGVSWHKRLGMWMAGIRVDYKRIHLGYFNTIEDAISARKAANKKYGFHENHGTVLYENT